MRDEFADAQVAVEHLVGLLALPARVSALEAKISDLTDAVHALRRALPGKFVAVPEAARFLGVSVSTLRRRIRSGEVNVIRVGRSIRIDLAALRPADEADVVRLADAARRGR